MKNAIIFHGTSGRPDQFWFPWLKNKLEERGYRVLVPQLPDADVPDRRKWTNYGINNLSFDSETVLIGHSAGCPLILSLLELIPTKVKKVILVAGFTELLDGQFGELIQTTYDWETIKTRAEEFIIINSDNDPWGCDDKAGRKMFDKLGGTLIIRHDGHFGSELYNQPYKEFPLLLQMVDYCCA